MPVLFTVEQGQSFLYYMAMIASLFMFTPILHINHSYFPVICLSAKDIYCLSAWFNRVIVDFKDLVNACYLHLQVMTISKLPPLIMT